MPIPATVAPQNAAGYWRSGWIKIGVGLLVVGAAPLLLMFGEGRHEETTAQGAKLPTTQGATA